MEREDSGSSCSAGHVILSFFIGGLIGAGIALLVAPKAGEESCKMIQDIAEDAKRKLEDYVNDAQEKANTFVEKGKELIEKKKTLSARS